MRSFLICFKKLFSDLFPNENVRIIEYSDYPEIKEYYGAFVFGDHMLCLGITHLNNPKVPIIGKNSLFPYVLFFGKKNDFNTKKRKTRIARFGEKSISFQECPIDESNLLNVCESMYLILHLLSEKDWGMKSTQICIDFLISRLLNIQQKSGELMYCTDIPKPIV